jgi:16S rRNA (cytidine1402-2'-O)-methyltransferase
VTLYVIATPIGNLGDLSPRALETLRAARFIYAEDTRHTRSLLTHFNIGGKDLRALHAHSHEGDIEAAIRLLKEDLDIALVSDAGTPLVSDPGEALVRRAIEEGIRVVPLPGPSAILAALVGSGLGGAAFSFVGFIARDGIARAEALGKLTRTSETVILFEAPFRTKETLCELASMDPTRKACVARELTKIHEEFVRGTLSELAALDQEWRGEVVIVIGPKEVKEEQITQERLEARIDEELAKGTHAKRIAELLSAWSGLPKREVYENVIARKPVR